MLSENIVQYDLGLAACTKRGCRNRQAGQNDNWCKLCALIFCGAGVDSLCYVKTK